MNAALIGSVSSSVAALEGMIEGGLEVTGVLGLDARHGAGVSDYCDLRPLAETAGIPYCGFRKVLEPEVAAFLRRRRPDWLFVIGLSQMVPAELCDLASAGAIGFHPTPLPKGRGRAPVAWTIIRGQPAAANLFFLTDEPDAGDIIGQRPVEVGPDDYARDLIDRTNVVLKQMVIDLCPAFAAGPVARTPQDHSRATYYERRRPEDGLIEWQQPAADVHRLIRAVSHPYPGAFTHMESAQLIIWRADLLEGGPAGGAPGTIVADRDGAPVVQAGGGQLALTDVAWIDAAPRDLAVGLRLG